MSDQFRGHSSGLSSPAVHAATVTPSATALANSSRALYVGGAGNMTVTMVGGETVEFTNMLAGVTYALRVTHVTAATATGIVAIW